MDDLHLAFLRLIGVLIRLHPGFVEGAGVGFAGSEVIFFILVLFVDHDLYELYFNRANSTHNNDFVTVFLKLAFDHLNVVLPWLQIS